MSNKYTEHLQVIVEDDANRQLTNGLSLNPKVRPRQLQVLPNACGWLKVLNRLQDLPTIRDLEAYKKRHLLLLIDFDNQLDSRLEEYKALKAGLPAGVADRIYLLGCIEEPEKFRAACNYSKSIEKLGLELSDDCSPPPAQNLWQHAHMLHNAAELHRLVTQVRPFLYVP
ncbi:MAG: hypothetical protein WCI59_18785 [Betaproteobacteria bacterium]|jgi:hypothetical protein